MTHETPTCQTPPPPEGQEGARGNVGPVEWLLATLPREQLGMALEHARLAGDTETLWTLEKAVADQDAKRELLGKDPQYEFTFKSNEDRLHHIAAARLSVAYRDSVGRVWVGLPQPDGTLRHVPLTSGAVKNYLFAAFYETTNKIVHHQTVEDVLATMRGSIAQKGVVRDNHTRVARRDDCLYYDLGGNQAVEVRPGAWQVVTYTGEPPIYWRREGGWRAQDPPVRPAPGSAASLLARLRRLLGNVTDDGFTLMVGFLLAVLNPAGPKPILAVTGEQGSGKSRSVEFLGSIVDPHGDENGDGQYDTAPRSFDDILTTTRARWLLSWDNISSVPDWMADLLCGIATGTAHNRRALYTDDDGFLFKAKRPMLVNGIEDVMTRPDLLSRAFLVKFTRFGKGQRRPEDGLRAELRALRPQLLGLLFDAAALALAQHGDAVQTDARMADTVAWVTRGEAAFGWEPGTFARAVAESEKTAAHISLESSTLGTVLGHYLEEQPATFTTTAGRLRASLEGRLDVTINKYWPTTDGHFSNKLQRLAPSLPASGWQLDFLPRTRDSRPIRFTRLDGSTDGCAPGGDAPGDARDAQEEGASRAEAGIQEGCDARDARDAHSLPLREKVDSISHLSRKSPKSASPASQRHNPSVHADSGVTLTKRASHGASHALALEMRDRQDLYAGYDVGQMLASPWGQAHFIRHGRLSYFDWCDGALTPLMAGELATDVVPPTQRHHLTQRAGKTQDTLKPCNPLTDDDYEIAACYIRFVARLPLGGKLDEALQRVYASLTDSECLERAQALLEYDSEAPLLACEVVGHPLWLLGYENLPAFCDQPHEHRGITCGATQLVTRCDVAFPDAKPDYKEENGVKLDILNNVSPPGFHRTVAAYAARAKGWPIGGALAQALAEYERNVA
jgi:hypothetical protein